MLEAENKLIYILQDSANKSLPLYLQKEGIKTEIHLFSDKVFQKLGTVKPWLIVFDFDNNEAEFIEQLHLIKGFKNLKESKIVFYSSIIDPFFELAAYEAGLDAFIQKPKKNRLFYLIINKFRAEQSKQNNETVKKKGLIIDREKFIVYLNNDILNLSKKEFELLELLLKKAGKVYTRNEISIAIWDGIDISKTRTIDVHIRKLRDKLGEGVIKTIKGVGYYIDRAFI